MKKLRVLFLGNSHTYFNDLPIIFKHLAEAGGKEVDVQLMAYPGVTFEWHLKQESQLRYELLHGNYDYMIMQQAAHSPCPSPEETIRDGKKIIELAKACGVTPILCMPWAERAYPEHQATMYNTYQTLSREAGVTHTPTGYVFERVLNERPDIDMYFVDGEHCSPYGSYTRALSIYAVIFNEDPTGLPPKSMRSVSSTVEEAKDFLEANRLYHESGQDPKMMEGLMKAAGNVFKSNWDKDTLYVDLDPEKAETLQKWVWEAATKNDLPLK
ncbi:MAG: hypothetical protein IIY73_02770 [Solobacterium sp.]|nr:hypothetical protein [Erysipelotrichaceae bacterium]MBQ1382816.1 hypothetical protein [Solobacterium sp.]MBQ1446247.1 hypothetical protein [Solobacterium sp.]MBQ6591796.1 hypothetical protein [Solobacterium sp.]MBR0478642.1 hypothetical protein [Solobacterium sp.]